MYTPLTKCNTRTHTHTKQLPSPRPAPTQGEDGSFFPSLTHSVGADAAAHLATEQEEGEEEDRDIPPAEGSCDVVLVDAPCSSTGVLRRHPSLRWTLEPQDALVGMAAQQKELLGQAQVR